MRRCEPSASHRDDVCGHGAILAPGDRPARSRITFGLVTDLTIGIVGGGQLARMMNEAATPLGLKVALLAEAPGVSAAQVVPDAVVGDYTDEATLLAFAREVDALTFDHEHVPAGLLRACADAGVAVRPGPDALLYAQDKAAMRARLTGLGVPCPDWRVVDTPADLVAFGDETGWPVINPVRSTP